MTKNAVTYKDLYLPMGKVISMEKLEIIQKPGCHGQLFLSAVLEGGQEETDFYELDRNVGIFYQEDGQEKVLFKGPVLHSSIRRTGNHIWVELEALDCTWLLDQKRKTRSFQNTGRTNHSVIGEIMADYPGSVCIKNVPEQEIGRIWFQYEETDWEFLRRFLSSWSDSLYADAAYQSARFSAGLSAVDIEEAWEDAPYSMGKDLERFDFLSQNGFTGLTAQQFVEYTIDRYELYPLGSRLNYRGAQWYIAGVKREMREGLLVNSYELKQKAGLLVVQKYNRRLTGVSVDGQTAEVERDKVRAAINGDLTKEQGTYWFPYSTVAASSDGSGWYSMPESGDSIRVYFPTCDEKEAYVITKHGSHIPAKPSGGGSGKGGGNGNSGGSFGGGGDGNSGGSFGGGGNGNSGGSSDGGGGNLGDSPGIGSGAIAAQMAAVAAGGLAANAAFANAAFAANPAAQEKADPMDDPDKRNIFTKDGNAIQLVPDGVLLSAGNASISLSKSGDVTVNAPGGITINAGKSLSISGQNITLEAGTRIELKNKSSYISMTKSMVRIHGKEIMEN